MPEHCCLLLRKGALQCRRWHIEPCCHVQVDRRSAALKARVEPSATLSHMTQLIMPQHANSLAITFGGQVRALHQQRHGCCSLEEMCSAQPALTSLQHFL